MKTLSEEMESKVREHPSVELCGPHVAIYPAMLRSSDEMESKAAEPIAKPSARVLHGTTSGLLPLDQGAFQLNSAIAGGEMPTISTLNNPAYSQEQHKIETNADGTPRVNISASARQLAREMSEANKVALNGEVTMCLCCCACSCCCSC